MRNKTTERKLFFRSWKKSIPGQENFFREDEYDEPHLQRKNNILKKYPDILKNIPPFSKDTKYYAICIALCMIFFMHHIKHQSISYCIFFSYFFGSSLSALGGIVIHDCGHYLASENPYLNQLYAYIANFTIFFPIAASFKKYHFNHHQYLGVLGKDPDLPINFEIKLVGGNLFMKILYLLIYPTFYVCRSFFIFSKPNYEEVLNFILQFFYLLLLFYFFNLNSLFFLLTSTWFAYSIHPSGAHLIQRHFTFYDGQETYSYYGILNYFFMNIGYHNEHHDFCNVPWEFLPLIKKRGKEFYTSLHSFDSWYGIMYIFIRYRIYGPQSRVYRSYMTHRKIRFGI